MTQAEPPGFLARVGLVVVSHSAALAEGVLEVAGQMATGVPMAAAGGTDDGSTGTSLEKTLAALEQVLGTEGCEAAVLFYDLGSSQMTAELAVEALGTTSAVVADAPLVEGSLAAAVAAAGGGDLTAVLRTAADAALSWSAARDAGEAGEGAGERSGGTQTGADQPGLPDAERTERLADPVGMHARPAGALAALARASGARVLLGRPEGPLVDASDVLALLGLDLRRDEKVRVVVRGPDAEQTADRLAELLRRP